VERLTLAATGEGMQDSASANVLLYSMSRETGNRTKETFPAILAGYAIPPYRNAVPTY
jgi:hypothetical protein